jgi:hypothetical protein
MCTVQNPRQKRKEDRRLPYQKPAIIYQGTITTRAGSPATITGDPEDAGVDPSDLFGDGG